MRAKSLILLVLALTCGLIASIGITQVMARRGADGSSAPEMVTIYLAVKDIAMNDPIISDMVKQEEWPKDKAPVTAITAWEDLENRRPKSRIFAGTPILDNQLLGKGNDQLGAGSNIPVGLRV